MRMGIAMGRRPALTMLAAGLALALALALSAPPPAAATDAAGTAAADAAKKGKGKKGKGKRGKKKVKRYKGPKIATTAADRCDFLDTSVCLHPWPNDLYLEPSPGTATGKRLALDIRSMPTNVGGKQVDPTEYNRSDGFSPGQSIVIHVDGLDNQQAFERSGFPPISNSRAYLRRKAPVFVLDVATGKRHPIFAEIDANPESDADRNLIIRPLRNWSEGGRYVVVLRGLKRANGEAIPPPNAFRVYRDRLITRQRAVEARREHFEKRVFRPLRRARAGKRKKLYMAWDFSVASAESLAGRALAMRNDAFARLGDTNLADRTIQGDSPAFTISTVVDNPNAEILRRVIGTIDDVPCYLNQDGCPPGAGFSFDSDAATMPSWNEEFTVDVPFQCDIPNSVIDGGSVDPARPVLYGHGLLGNRTQAGSSYIRTFSEAHNLSHCAVNWDGFSDQDVIPTIMPALSDLDHLPRAFDRVHQGFVNFLMLGRAMIHPDGLSSDPAFAVDAGGGPVPALDTEELYFHGISQGGVMGGALTSLAPDFQRSVLGVPGMNYSTLLRRSIDFDEYAHIPVVGLYDSYPNELERPVMLSLMQMIWDRAETNGYAHHVASRPYPNTPSHQPMLQVALGDHQVANVTAEVEARTMRARVLTPAVGPGRHWDSSAFSGIPSIASFPYRGPALIYFDGGPVGFAGDVGGGSGVPPNENVPPRTETGFGSDPHGYPRRAPEAQQQMSDWMRPNGALLGGCSGGKPCYSNGWTGP